MLEAEAFSVAASNAEADDDVIELDPIDASSLDMLNWSFDNFPDKQNAEAKKTSVEEPEVEEEEELAEYLARALLKEHDALRADNVATALISEFSRQKPTVEMLRFLSQLIEPVLMVMRFLSSSSL